MKWEEFCKKDFEGNKSLTEQFRALLDKAGQPGVQVSADPYIDGDTKITINRITVEPEDVVYLALALRLVGRIDRKRFEAINALLDCEVNWDRAEKDDEELAEAMGDV